VGFISGLVIGLVIGLAFGVIGSRLKMELSSAQETIKTVELLSWSWRRASVGLFIGLVVGLVVGLGAWLAGNPSIQLLIDYLSVLIVGGRNPWLALALAIGLATGLVAGLFSGLVRIETKQTVVPNEGIWRSLQNTIRTGLVALLAIALPVGIAGRLVFGLVDGSIIGLMSGLAFGVGVGIFFGGYAVIQHYILRFILYCNNRIPWNLTRFLDYATDRIFLRKVGGGYIFIHRMLQEHFASLAETKEVTQ